VLEMCKCFCITQRNVFANWLVAKIEFEKWDGNAQNMAVAAGGSAWKHSRAGQETFTVEPEFDVEFVVVLLPLLLQ
jgi:hypothetical protein